jgi:hypothetical protein
LPFLACAGDLVFLLPPEDAEDFPAIGTPLRPRLAAGDVATDGAGTTVFPFGLYAGFAADFFVPAGDFFTAAAEEDFLTLFVAALASPTERNPKDNTAAERKSLLDKDSELIALAWMEDLLILDCCFFCAATFTFVAQKDAD